MASANPVSLPSGYRVSIVRNTNIDQIETTPLRYCMLHCMLDTVEHAYSRLQLARKATRDRNCCHRKRCHRNHCPCTLTSRRNNLMHLQNSKPKCSSQPDIDNKQQLLWSSPIEILQGIMSYTSSKRRGRA